MTQPALPAATERVVAAARSLGLAIDARVHAAPTRTAEEAAAACGCDVGQIVKSLIFRGATSNRPYLLLVSGRNRVDEKGVAAHLGEDLRRPDAADVRALTSFAIGGIPPFGHAEPMETLVDPDLLTYPTVWAAAGTPNTVFSIDPAVLAKATGARIVPMAG
ncbi:MAG TPA: YbaK/EbsC family protein [Beijerinckiaceae bacterium]|nr:YbaK/EbsC family protein [Beijerinckiaceae bacterium]